MVLTEIVNNATQIYQHRISCFQFSQSKTCNALSEPKDRTMEVLNSNSLPSDRT